MGETKEQSDVTGVGPEGAVSGHGDSGPAARPLLICHEGAELDRVGLARWLASFSDLRGVVVLREPGARLRKRVRREVARVGYARFLDVLSFRLHYRLFNAARDREWEREE